MERIIKRIIYPLVLGFVFGGILGNCSRPGAETPAPGDTTKMIESRNKAKTLEDTWLHAQIVSKLIANPETPQRKINVDVVDKVVTLRGVVESEEQKNEAEIVTKATQGVKRVNNQLTVVKNTTKPPSRSFVGMVLLAIAAATGRK